MVDGELRSQVGRSVRTASSKEVAETRLNSSAVMMLLLRLRDGAGRPVAVAPVPAPHAQARAAEPRMQNERDGMFMPALLRPASPGEATPGPPISPTAGGYEGCNFWCLRSSPAP